MDQFDAARKDIIAELDRLPPEALLELRDFIEFLHYKSRRGARPTSVVKTDRWGAALAATFGMWADRDDVEDDGVTYVRSIRRG